MHESEQTERPLVSEVDEHLLGDWSRKSEEGDESEEQNGRRRKKTKGKGEGRKGGGEGGTAGTDRAGTPLRRCFGP